MAALVGKRQVRDPVLGNKEQRHIWKMSIASWLGVLAIWGSCALAGSIFVVIRY